jgi:hypothetical protein
LGAASQRAAWSRAAVLGIRRGGDRCIESVVRRVLASRHR